MPGVTIQRASFTGRSGEERGRVLVIGNDEGVRDVLAILTVIEGCDVRDTRDGPDAHEAIVAWRPHLLLIDADGLGDGQLSVRAYRETLGPGAPIVIVSAHLIAEVELTAMAANSALQKPFAVVELLQLLDQLVGCS
jgi:DNA-binding response OmpR family regulator